MCFPGVALQWTIQVEYEGQPEVEQPQVAQVVPEVREEEDTIDLSCLLV